MWKILSVGVLFILGLSSFVVAEEKIPTKPVAEPATKLLSDNIYPDLSHRRFAFGSCNKPKMDQDFWNVMRDKEPDIMLHLGDNHYAESTKLELLEKAYDELAAIPQYKAFRQHIPIFATWDNHDYGAKYFGRLHPHAEQSEQLFLDHFAIPKADERRNRKGVYGTWIFGKKPHRVQVIMLDLQRFRDPFKEKRKAKKKDGKKKNKNKRQFPAESGKTLMGTEQWKWFEEQLKKEAEVRIVGSAIQVLSNDHLWRRWGMFSDDRERLLRVISETKGTTILLSGDRHRGEISVLDPSGKRPLYDITASSFNHSYPAEEKNDLRDGKLISQTHFGWLEIDWEKGSIEMQLLSAKNGKPLITRTVKIKP